MVELKGSQPLTEAEVCATVLGRRSDRVKGMGWLPSGKRGKSSTSSSGFSQRERDELVDQTVSDLRLENMELKESFQRLKEKQEQEIAEIRKTQEEKDRLQEEKDRLQEEKEQQHQMQMNAMQKMMTDMYNKFQGGGSSS